MLFSEPKIPQLWAIQSALPEKDDFSALQRAENSSIRTSVRFASRISHFSALQRAENSSIELDAEFLDDGGDFSALQRAENSSMDTVPAHQEAWGHFSALQRAENSSIEDRGSRHRAVRVISVLFSEPKIPQSRRVRSQRTLEGVISVLFSEPKIPQWRISAGRRRHA